MGVGATMAPGSQLWNGYCADLVKAPTRTRTRATPTRVPPGGSATSAEIRYVPPAWPSSTNPPSMASPPRLVTSSACSAAARASGSSSSMPMSRYDVTEVSSQHT